MMANLFTVNHAGQPVYRHDQLAIPPIEQVTGVATDSDVTGLEEQVRALRRSFAALCQHEKIAQEMQTTAASSVAPAFADIEDKLNKLEQTAQALLQREAYYRGILQNLPFFANVADNLNDAVITVDLKFRIQSWNRAAEQLYGWCAEAVIGKPVEDILSTDYGAGVERTALWQLFLAQGWWQGEVIQQRQDHTQLNILGSATFLRNEQGAPIGVILINRDITERKRTEATLREQRDLLQLVIDKVPGVILVQDRAGSFHLVNQYFAERSNCTPADVVGKTQREFMGPSAGLDAIEQRNERAWATLQPLFIPEEKVFDYTYQTHCIPLQNASGEYDRLLIVAIDITARHHAEAAIRRSEERFRQIVTTMQGGLVIYDVNECITFANERFCELSGYALPELIGATSYSLVAPEYAPFIDAQLVHRRQGESTTYEIVAKRKDGQRVHWLVSSSPWYDDQHTMMGSAAALPLLALDQNLMRQVLTNLVGNALKYSAPATTVCVVLTYTDTQLSLSIQDEGMGIPPDDLAHLFQPFQRASNVGAIGGTGLGLVIAKEAVELHGGAIKVTSQLGIGTTFTVTLPASLPAASHKRTV